MTAPSRFISTRGGAGQASFSEVLLAGLAPDGGLYLPASWPRFTETELRGFAGRRYQDVAFSILSPFVEGTFSSQELKEDIEAAYAGFERQEIAPLSPMSGNRYLLELFHGPTYSFKDIALQILGRLFARALGRNGRRATVVAATSGDTGSAAISALGGLPNIEVFVLHPKGRISDIQRLQMTATPFANVHNIALEGSFDDAQSIVKQLFADKEFARGIGLTAVNSINFVRIAAQSVYYFTAAAQLPRPAIFVVPTGNFGDVFAGEAASRMGLGVKRLVVATNENDIMARAINHGVYQAGEAHRTLSPAMDIQVASNFERALFEASGRDADWLRGAMESFAQSRLELPAEVLERLRARYDAKSSSDEETLATINAVAGVAGRIVDPHTAVALSASRKLGFPEDPVVVLATAHPAKFADAVREATGTPPPMPERLEKLLSLPEKLDILPNALPLIRQFISSRLAG